MYQVSKVEHIGYIIKGYLFSGSKPMVSEMMIQFRKYINSEFESKEDADWLRLIRFYSSSDQHSLKLFEQKFTDFILAEYSEFVNVLVDES